MGFFMDFVVASIVAAIISISMDNIVVHYINVVLRSERTLESLINTVITISQNSYRVRGKCDRYSLIHEWDRRSLQLATEASRMMGEHTGFSKLNIFSLYRRSKDIANLISEIDNHLKLVPFVQFDCVLSRIIGKRDLQKVMAGGGGLPFGDFTAGIVDWVITSAFLVMFFYIGRVRNFKKELRSFRDLLEKMHPFVMYSRNKIICIQLFNRNRNRAGVWLYNARDWVSEMNAIIREGMGINDTWSPIGRFRKSKEIRELTSRIDAHLNKVSWITLELLFHESLGSANRPLPLPATGQTSHQTSPQETLTPRRPSTSSYETEGSTSHPREPQEMERLDEHPREPQEMEGSTSHPREPQEMERLDEHPRALQETEGSTSHPREPQEMERLHEHPRAPQETEGSTSHPREPQEMERLDEHPRAPQETEGLTSHPRAPQETEGSPVQEFVLS